MHSKQTQVEWGVPAFFVVKYIIFFFFLPPIPAHRGPETERNTQYNKTSNLGVFFWELLRQSPC